MFRTITAAAVTVLALCSVALGQPAPVEDPKDPKNAHTRTYDLGDLLRVTRHYPLEPSMIPATRFGGEHRGGGGGGGGGQGMFGGDGNAQSAATTEPLVTAEGMIELVMETVDPESWRDKGGQVGSVRILGTRLIVTQTPFNHEQIGGLLEQLREDGSYMVAVRARWVAFSPAELGEVFAKAGAQKTGGAIAEVPDNLLREDNIYSQGQTLGYNGQTVHVASTRANTVVTGMDPVVGTNAVGYNLETAVIPSGVALQVTPHVMDDGRSVSLDLRSIVSEVEGAVRDGAVPQTQPVSERDAMLFVDRPSVIAQQFSTTVRVPAGKKVLIGGMTLDPAEKEQGAKQLYLVIEATTSK
jgi:hypothetical protein